MANATELISFGLGCLGLLFLFFMYGKYRIDKTRDDLFALRDELFLFAYDHGLMERAAYRNLRQLINGLIRYTHRLSMARLLWLAFVCRVFGIKHKPSKIFSEMNASMATLPAEQRAVFDQFHSRANNIMAKHIVLRSPMLMAIAPSVAIYIIITHETIHRVKSSTLNAMTKRAPKEAMDILEEEALECALAA